MKTIVNVKDDIPNHALVSTLQETMKCIVPAYRNSIYDLVDMVNAIYNLLSVDDREEMEDILNAEISVYR